jgi:Protein of unknown function (DUF2515)
MPSTPTTVEGWQQLVIGRLPPADQVLARNFALTAQYARWYKAYPRLFKWAGMASFSSHRVGIALAPYEFEVDVEKALNLENADIAAPAPIVPLITDVQDVHGREIPLSSKSEILPGLNLLRQTNNAVFKDIGWAHEAYTVGGIAAVEDAIGSDTRYTNLRDGFRLIHHGRSGAETGQSAAAEQAVWDGNMLLLKHEQYEVIQPWLDQVTVLFDDFLSAATLMTYFVNPFQIHPFKMTAFPLAMLFFGLPGLLSKRSLPKFTNFEQRWFWITRRVVPIFRRLDGADAEINAGIEEIIAAGGRRSLPL